MGAHLFSKTVLYIAERGLALRGSVEKLGDPLNGNFLGLLELIAEFDPLLNLFLAKVRKSQEDGRRMQAHYLSCTSQNEFLGRCGDKVRNFVVDECHSAVLFSTIVDATPDNSHIEQQTFVLRYVVKDAVNKEYVIKELFLEFVDCNKKTGTEIANLVLDTLKKRGLDPSKMRGQGYDNGSNMSGKYKGCQAEILNSYPLATFSACTSHSLNLVGSKVLPYSHHFFRDRAEVLHSSVKQS